MSQQVQSGRWTLGDYVGLVGGVSGIASVIFACLSWKEAIESRKIAADAQALSQKSYDRSAGKVTALFSLERFSPSLEKIPADLKFRSPLGTEEVRVESPTQVRRLRPRLIVRNVGGEAIDTFRVETKLTFLAVHGGGPDPERPWGMTPLWRLRQADREDFQLSKKLLSGEWASIPLERGLVGQIMRTPPDGRDGENHYGRVEIKAYGRLVGVTAFDDAEQQGTLAMSFVWVPKGFTQEVCEQFLKDYNFDVEIVDPGRAGDPVPRVQRK